MARRSRINPLAHAWTGFGNDYPSRDGTSVRDYVHVRDLAAAHLKALDVLQRGASVGPINLGNGEGYSVKEVLDCCERVLGLPVPWTLGDRRAGDPASLIADTSRARDLLGWMPRYSALERIVEDAARSRRVS